MNFFYSFTVTGLHSLWQSAILLLLYTMVNVIVKRIHPLEKRNFLYALLAAQVLTSCLTFSYYFSGHTFYGIGSLPGFTSRDTGLAIYLLQYADVIFAFYAAVVFYRFFAIWYQRAVFKKACNKHIIKPPVGLKLYAEQRAYQLGIKRKVTLRYCDNIKVPFTYGFFKPFILLPFSLVNNLTLQETESIILHELTHIKNRDYLFNLLLLAAETVYCFNPFIKMIARKIRSEREKNCDVQVINFTSDPVEYAGTLLKIARFRNGIKDFQLAAVRKKPELLKRIYFFSDRKNLVFTRCHSAVPALCIIFFMAGMVCFMPNSDQEKPGNSQIVMTPVQTSAPLSSGTENIFPAITYTPPVIVAEVTPPEHTAEINAGENFTEIADESEVNADALFTSFKENPDSTREFIYKEETQHGKITQSYKLLLVNGEWIMLPQWMMLETRPDSTRRILTDTLPPAQ